MAELNKEVVDLVWGRPSGGSVSESIFRRWTQGRILLSLKNIVHIQQQRPIKDVDNSQYVGIYQTIIVLSC